MGRTGNGEADLAGLALVLVPVCLAAAWITTPPAVHAWVAGETRGSRESHSAGRGGAALEPLYEAHKRFVLFARILHADETAVAMLDPGAGKTKPAYVWAYAREPFDAASGVIYEFCAGRGAQYPIAFLGGTGQQERSWRGTLVRDEYKAYDRVMAAQSGRIAAGCLAHARRSR